MLLLYTEADLQMSGQYGFDLLTAVRPLAKRRISGVIVLTLEERRNTDDDLDCVAKRRIQETGESLTQFERKLVCGVSQELHICVASLTRSLEGTV